MKIINTKSKTFKKNFNLILGSKRSQSNDKQNIVKKIINDVRKNGDSSLIKYTKKFDKIKLTPSKNVCTPGDNGDALTQILGLSTMKNANGHVLEQGKQGNSNFCLFVCFFVGGGCIFYQK